MLTLRARRRRDAMVHALLILAVIIVMTPLLAVISYVLVNGLGSLSLDFFTQDLGSPARAQQGRPTGLMHTIIGTLVIDGLALAFVLPFGIGAGVLLAEFPDHPLNPSLRVLTDTLNGMPAILKGLLAYALIVQPMGSFSALSGSVALAFVMLPILARATESALAAVPWSLREATLALGVPRWRVILSTSMPAARVPIVTGVLIAFARAAGEAAPLMLTSFGNNYLTFDLLAPMDTLPQRLYSLAVSPYREWHAMGWGAAVLLLGLVIIVFVGARVATRRRFP
ncbi:MAG: phosphate ABC transporter permease PstA [Trueperaceae bacterium]